MSTANAKGGSALEPRAIQETTPQAPIRRFVPSVNQDQDLVLAQIPDLDPKATPKVPEKRTEGRIINQALSIKLVFGVGLLLVIGAILPFVFGKASRPEPPVTELPASWSSNSGSPGNSGSTSQTMAPPWPTATAPTTAAVPPQTAPALAPAILSPQPPQVGDTRPMALTEPAWPQPRSSGALPPAITPGPNNYANPPVVGTNPPDNRGAYRGFDRPVDPQNLQADNRNDPATQYRNNDARYDYRGNPLENSPIRRDVPANGYPAGIRYDSGNGNYRPPAGPGSALMPSGTVGPTSTYRDPQISEPGVARFDGTIATPPVRTSYDRTGSSTN